MWIFVFRFEQVNKFIERITQRRYRNVMGNQPVCGPFIRSPQGPYVAPSEDWYEERFMEMDWNDFRTFLKMWRCGDVIKRAWHAAYEKRTLLRSVGGAEKF